MIAATEPNNVVNLQHERVMQQNRQMEYDVPNDEVKRWELEPIHELESFRTLLYGTPYIDKETKEPATDEEGKLLYLTLPKVNREGAESLHQYIMQNCTKLISMGFFDAVRLNDMLYNALLQLCQMMFLNYKNWELKFDDVPELYGVASSVIHASYTRALNGNEKVYRGRSQTSHEHKVINTTTPTDNPQPQGIIRKFIKKVI